MSLNGLDAPDVLEAYNATGSDPAGWFILRYANRDSVELLGRGRGGVAEARQSIAQYTEASPLYGLIMYRRRKILIKYVPDGTSRLLQARTTVHLQDILERYAPYETLLEINSPEDLNDTSLAASFPLHTASQSVASNRLREISEDGEEGGVTGKTQGQIRQTAAQRYQVRRMERGSPSIESLTGKTLGDRSTSPRSVAPSFGSQSTGQTNLTQDESSRPSTSTIGMPSRTSITDDGAPEASTRDMESVTSTAPDTPKANSYVTPPLPQIPLELAADPKGSDRFAERPSTAGVKATGASSERSQKRLSLDHRPTAPMLNDDDPYDIAKFFKPKVKLGPRPVADAERTRRSMVPSIALVPANYRSLQRKQQQQSQTQTPSRLSSAKTTGTNLTPPSLIASNASLSPPPIPDLPEYNPRPLSRGSIKSIPSQKSSAMTPDKMRLLKAVELRKRKMRKSHQVEQTLAPSGGEDASIISPLPSVEEGLSQHAKDHSAVDRPQELEKDASPPEKTDSGIGMAKTHVDGLDQSDAIEPHSVLAPAAVAMEGVQPESTETEHHETVEPERELGEHIQATPTARSPTSIHSESTIKPPDSPTSQYSSAVDIKLDAELEALTVNEEVNVESLITEDESAQTKSKSSEADASSTLVDSSSLPVEPTSEIQDTTRGPPPQSDKTRNESTSQNPALMVPTILMSEPSQDSRESASSDLATPVQSRTADVQQMEAASSSSDTLAIPERNPRRLENDLARRRGLVEALNVETELDASSGDDDDFIDDLGAVTFGDAQAVTVSKSPVTALFTRRPSTPSGTSDAYSVRTASISNAPAGVSYESFVEPSEGYAPVAASPLRNVQRPVSPPTPPPPEKPEPPAGAKRSVSSGISKRIQALAEQSSRESSPHSFDGLGRDNNATIPSLQTRKNSFRQLNRREDTFESPTNPNSAQLPFKSPMRHLQLDPLGHESISVSARIVRSRNESTDSEHAQFRQSHLVINHSRATSQSTGSSIVLPIQKLPSRSESYASTGSTSSAISQIEIPSRGPAPGSFANQRAVPPPPLPNALIEATSPPRANNDHVHRPTSPGTSDESAVTKEGTRASRFFRRMSHLGSKRKPASIANTSTHHITPNPLNIGPETAYPGTPPAPPTSTIEANRMNLPSIVFGNLNVQFPDTLLWKRRVLSIDEFGILHFSVPQAMEHQKLVGKSYPLTSFRQPYIPDLDRQELPNSVLLDFIDGSTTLQAACEDAAAQRQLVTVLKTYWRSWNMI